MQEKRERVERHWGCCFPGCKERFSDVHDQQDKYFCKKHLAEKHNLRNKIRYALRKSDSKYYRRKRAESLKREITKHEKTSEMIYKMLQMNRAKMEVMMSELKHLEDTGVFRR